MEGIVTFYSVVESSSRLANSARPDAPVVIDEPKNGLALWRSSRLGVSRMFRWLADALEPAVEACSSQPRRSQTA